MINPLIAKGITLMLLSTDLFCVNECHHQIPKHFGLLINGKCLFSCVFYGAICVEFGGVCACDLCHFATI